MTHFDFFDPLCHYGRANAPLFQKIPGVQKKNNGSLRFSGHFSIDLGFISMYHWRFNAWFIHIPPGIDPQNPTFHASMRRVVPATPAVMAGTLMADSRWVQLVERSSGVKRLGCFRSEAGCSSVASANAIGLLLLSGLVCY